MSEVSRILTAIDHGDSQATARLFLLVYDELRRLAVQKLAQERSGQTLQATALVHEAYLQLAEAERAGPWNGRTHFFRAAAEAMRHILVDRARQKKSHKRGAGWKQVDLEAAAAVVEEPSDEVVAVHEALELLAQHDPIKAELVKLRYFVGLSVEEAADLLGISRATADRHWRYAKTWLYCALTRRELPDAP
jgi:RNA polymerase sigma factor (TIGR02999 family)